MKIFLMYRDKNFNNKIDLPWNGNELIDDFGLNNIFTAMASGDKFLFDIAKKTILNYENDMETLLYRQNVLRDCMDNESTVRSLYSIVVNSINLARKRYFWYNDASKELIIDESIDVLDIFIDTMDKLRGITEQAGNFHSTGFQSLFSMIKNEFNDDYLNMVKIHLNNLSFKNGVYVSTALGTGNEGIDYMLHKNNRKHGLHDILNKHYVFTLPDRDISGAQELNDIKKRGILRISEVMKEATNNVINFFESLKNELAFYIGCLNIYDKIREKNYNACFPVISENTLLFSGLYDMSLSLILNDKIVTNDLNKNGKLYIITGTNRGGKSTFLRSTGEALLMMQSGMFVPASSFTSGMHTEIFTHFKREEDNNMNIGKFDEELKRMNDIIEHISSNSIIFFNESFSATNAREGSGIAGDIINALLEKNIKIFIVTHMYELAAMFLDNENSVFLTAEREENGDHTFRIIPGFPLKTSYGEDLYKKIFGESIEGYNRE